MRFATYLLLLQLRAVPSCSFRSPPSFRVHPSLLELNENFTAPPEGIIPLRSGHGARRALLLREAGVSVPDDTEMFPYYASLRDHDDAVYGRFSYWPPTRRFDAARRRRRSAEAGGNDDDDDIFSSTPLFQGMGTHYADVWVGTPPQRQSVIIDTGSSSTAFPCAVRRRMVRGRVAGRLERVGKVRMGGGRASGESYIQICTANGDLPTLSGKERTGLRTGYTAAAERDVLLSVGARQDSKFP